MTALVLLEGECVDMLFCWNVGLFGWNVGLFGWNVGLFGWNIGLFCWSVGLFCLVVGKTDDVVAVVLIVVGAKGKG